MTTVAIGLTFDEGAADLRGLLSRLAWQAEEEDLSLALFAAPPPETLRSLFDAVEAQDRLDLHVSFPSQGQSATAACLSTAIGALCQDGHAALAAISAAVRPEPGWLAAQLREIRAGADIVCAAMEPAPLPDERSRTLELLAEYHRLMAALEAEADPDPFDPAPRHRDESPYSVGVSPRACRSTDLRTLQASRTIEHLIASARLDGAQIRHPGDCRIRVPGSLYLRLIDPDRAPDLVPDPVRERAHWTARALRRAALLAQRTGLSEDEHRRRVRASLALSMPDGRCDLLPLREALRRLRTTDAVRHGPRVVGL